MARRQSNNRQRGSAQLATTMVAQDAYRLGMTLIRARLNSLDANPANEAALVRAERLAVQVRKIVEGVAYGALSACEYRNAQILRDQRTKDADKLLGWLERKGMLKLPQANRIQPSPSAEFKAVFEGAQRYDLDVPTLRAMYSRASVLIHERHPERLDQATVDQEMKLLEEDGRRLREWLWLHLMFLKGEAFLIQMGQYGTDSFMHSFTRIGDLPEGV